jgi:4-amino-4-deoxy-L-arabinose transferase-like glycosyltransferase
MTSIKDSPLLCGRRWLCLLFLAALAVRAAFVAFAVPRGDELMFPDAAIYDSIARNWLAGKGFREDSGRQASRAPGYPVFLAACHSMGLQRPQGIYLVQAVADSAMCVLLALLGRRLYGDAAGIVAGCIAAIYPFFVYFTGLLLAETLFTLGLVALMLFLFQCADALEKSVSRALLVSAVAGALLGLLVLLRSSLLLFPLFLLPIWLFSARRSGGAAKSGLTRRGHRLGAMAAWGTMIVAMALVMLPWMVRNYGIFGRFIPTTLQVGESLYEANSPYADGGPAMDRIDWVKERGGRPMGEYENNEFFKSAAIRYIREHPGRFCALAVEKFARFWNPLPNYGPYRRPLGIAVSLCAFVPIILLACAGILRRKREAASLLLLLSPVAYFTLLHMVFVGSVRYRTPVMPLVILLAASGAEAVWAWRRSPVKDSGDRLRAPARET